MAVRPALMTLAKDGREPVGVNVWVRETGGPRRLQGVSGKEQGARQAIEDEIRDGAPSGVFERAVVVRGTPMSCHELTGDGATAVPGVGGIIRTRFQVIRQQRAP
jgi:hypothetical protein